MSDREPEGLLEKAGEELGEAGLAAPMVVRDRRGRWHRAWKITQWGLLVLLGLAVVGAVVLWTQRKPIANNYLAKELAKRGVQATYHLDKVGLRTQQVSNLVLGDPAHPDLTARFAQVQLQVGIDGSFRVYRVVARGVRLNGRLVGNRVSWGQIDKLLPPPSAKPFALPNLAVDIADTSVRLATPYGLLGIGVAGSGNLSGGFKGRLAASAPSLRPGRCSLEGLRANLAASVTARHPHLTGPLSATAFNCPTSHLALTAPRMEIDSDFSEAFGSFDGSGRLSFASLVAGANGLAHVTSKLTFKGTPNLIEGQIELGAQRARLAQILANRTRLAGHYRVGAKHGILDLVADYGAAGVALEPGLTRGLTDPLDAAAKTPLGPITSAIARAIRAGANNFNVSGKLVAVNRPGAGLVRIGTANATAATGASVQVGSGDGISYYWPSGRLRIDGDIATSGGGLPQARVTLHQPRGGGAKSGTAEIAPYAAGGSRLALAPVRFAAAPDGSTRVSTIALLDGPFQGGRVRGLRLPIDGQFGGRTGLMIGRGCIDASFAALQFGSLRLGATRLPVCPTAGAILAQAPGGPLQIRAITRNLALAGMLGRAPFRLNAGSVRSTGDRAFEAAALALRLGKTSNPVAIDAARVVGSFGGPGVGGTFTGGKAIIGAVPLLLTEAAGKWSVRHGDIVADGNLTVSHRDNPPLFYPLRGEGVHFVLANDMINATGRLVYPGTGDKVSDVTIQHRLSSGRGDAVLDVPGLKFRPGFQPDQLTSLSEGIIALVNGTVRGQGRIAWGEGDKVTSTGTFEVANMDLAAPFGPVTGLNTTIHFTDLLGLETLPGQTATVGTINPGILVENGQVRYSLLPGRLVKVERGEWPFMGGKLILQETILNFDKPTAKRLTFEVQGLDAHTFIESMGFKEIDAQGMFDGVLPMVFDESGGRIVGGRLDSRPGGGVLQYNGVINRANIGLMAKVAFDALKDLRFKSMIIRLDGYLDGEFATRLTIEGVGLGQTNTAKLIRRVTRKLPLMFNVTIKGPFRALIGTAKSFRDPRLVIDDALPRPLDEVPGIVTEVRNTEENQQQTQSPVDQQIKITPPTLAPPARQ